MKDFISVHNLNKSFYTPAGELNVLKDIDVVFQKGETIGIVGASGTGKSTFLHILGTLDKPTSGQIIYRMQDASNEINPFILNSKELSNFRNKVIGFIFQFHYLLPEFNVIENAMIPLLISKKYLNKESVINKAKGLLDDVGLSDRLWHRPGELSGGEQQRIAVVRALINDPEVILADEPTGNLDARTGEDVFNLLKDIRGKKNITIVLVTHNENLAKKCDKLFEMSDGKLINK